MQFPRFSDAAAQLLTPDSLARVLGALVVLVAGLLLGRLLARVVFSVVQRSASPERADLARRVVWWGIAGLSVATALDQLGFDLTLLAGAAGVLTVAVGFASQTSASNVISGLFLIAERPFSVGDVVEIGGRTGEVLSIDLLSTKIRTFDNLFVRVPNESVMKGEIVNTSRFPVRRLDVMLTVGRESDLDVARDTLIQLCDSVPEVLDEPRPELRVVGLSASGIDLMLIAWTQRVHLVRVKTTLYTRLVVDLRAAGVEIPYAQIVVRPTAPSSTSTPPPGASESP